MLSLHDLRAPAVVLDWHESVAVAASLTSLLIDARADACPAASDVALLASGDLRVSGPALQPGPPAAAVAGLLAAWLDASPGPAELVQLARSYAADDRTGSGAQDALAALLSSLAFYERPGRQATVASLVARVASTVEQVRRIEALEALTARTRVAAGADPLATPAPAAWSASVVPVPPRPASGPVGTAAAPAADAADVGDPEPAAWGAPADNPWRLAAPAAAAIMVFVGMAYLAASWIGDRTAPPVRRAAEVEDDLPISGTGALPSAPAGAPAAGSRRAAPARSVAASPAAPAVAAETAASTPAAATTAAPGSTPAPSAAPPTASGPGGVEVAVAEREGRVVASPIAPVRPVGRPALGGRVFTSGDPQVTPAVLIRPHLPEQPPPDVPEEHIGTLEFVVAESGAVEHVHLISPANRYQERMLVAAAKTWQFQPATRDGRPVRFRIRVRVTL